MIRYIAFFLLYLCCFSVSFGETRTDSIKIALQYQRTHYPTSQYRDVYKNFMQDYYGPGHLLNDTLAAGKSLRNELTGSEKFEGPDFEPTGFEGNFYRVNLRLINDGTIPYSTFFEAFVNSVQSIVPPSGDDWMNIWKEIDFVISQLDWTFENENEDRSALEEQFKNNNYVVHHSKAFTDTNHFHYRIISKDNFNKIILPLLKTRDSNK